MPGPVQSIERTAAILRLLSHGPLPLTEIAQTLGLAKSTAHGIVATLRAEGFVAQDGRTAKYELGEGLRHLTSPGMDANEIRSRATNIADALASNTGQAVYVGVLDDETVRLVHHVFRPDNSHQTLETGSQLPAHATALGKVLLAYLGSDLRRLRMPVDTYTRRTLVDPAALRSELRTVRSRGWAQNVDEFIPGRAALAAPLRSAGGTVVAALGVSGSTDDLCRGERRQAAVVAQVVAAARSVSRELGYSS